MRAVSLVVCVALLGCATGRQAHRTKAVAEKVAAGALLTMLAAAAVGATFPSTHDEVYPVGLAMVPVSLVAVGVYIGADTVPGSEGEDVPRARLDMAGQRRNQLARDLAKAGAEAARSGDCDRVRQLVVRVSELDTNVYVTMLHYRRIADCVAVQSGE